MVVAAALEWWKPLQLSLPQCSVLACSALPIDLPAVAIDRRAAAAAAAGPSELPAIQRSASGAPGRRRHKKILAGSGPGDGQVGQIDLARVASYGIVTGARAGTCSEGRAIGLNRLNR